MVAQPSHEERQREFDVMLHQLRSPITAIMITAELASEPESSVEELRNCADVALRQAGKLAELLDEFSG